jgi:hypothetical protein
MDADSETSKQSKNKTKQQNTSTWFHQVFILDLIDNNCHLLLENISSDIDERS